MDKIDSRETQEMLQFLKGKSILGSDKETGERAFRWGLVFQIKEMMSDLSRIKDVVLELQHGVKATEELRIRFTAVEKGMQELEKKIGSENLHDIKGSVDSIKAQLEAIKNQLLKSDPAELAAKVKEVQEWIHERELLLSAERLRELIASVNSHNNFKVQVMAIVAAALSGLTFIATVFKIFGGQ